MSAAPEIVIRVRLEAKPSFEVAARADDIDRLADWIGTARAQRELRTIARSLALLAGLRVADD